MPERKQMNDCLKVLQNELKILKDRKEHLKSKMKVQSDIVNSIDINDADEPKDKWYKANRISKYNREWNIHHIEVRAVEMKIALLNKILSQTKCWDVQCC